MTRHLAIAAFLFALAGCANSVDDNAGDRALDDDRQASASVDAEPVTCSPTIVDYPVRGKHNNGYDGTAGDHSQWSCNSAHSNSDFVPGDHLGNDIWAERGTNVVATQSGTVLLTGWSDYSGNKVTIKDSCGWYHFFCHLDSIAPGIHDGVHVTAGQLIGHVGNTGTASNGVIHLHYSLYPNDNYDAGIDPWSRLHAVESNVCTMPAVGGGGGGAPPPAPAPALTKHWVTTFANAAGRASPSPTATRRGTLNAGHNYVFCKKWGGEVSSGASFNHWWLLTDLDEVNAGQSGRAYVSAYYLSKWGNDVAKDDDGHVIPTCN